MFKKCVESVYANLPVNNLFVIDGNSKDGTIKFLSKYPNVKIYVLDENRTIARQKGIELVNTSGLCLWIVIVSFLKDGLRRLKKFME